MSSILGRRSRILVPFQAAWRDWLSEDAPIIGYLIKVLLACLLAMWMSLRFELDQPRTAMLTVAIVMQSRSGMVFAKSYYRLLGTLVGVLMSFLLVAMFAQERVLFLLCMVIWIGLCTAGSMIYRNHQSYAFVLAGYTLCIVGLPATISPELTFNIGVTRISEIMIGLLCATIVSDLIFPQRLWDVMLASVRRRFSDFSGLLHSTAQNPATATTSKTELLRFIGDIYSLESFRASAVLENDESRRHRLRLSWMNKEFMEVSTSFHTFEQLLRRQRNSGHPQVGDALLTLYRQLGDAVMVDGNTARTEHEASIIVGQLAMFRIRFAQNMIAAQQQLPHDLSDNERLDFATGIELLQRLAEELHAYARTYASLATDKESAEAPRLSEQPALGMHFDPLAVALAGVRGALTLAIMTALWIFTDWRSGIEGITIGVITSTLFATTPSPTRTIKQFMIGAVIGTVLAYVCNFHLLTQAQGFLMLALAVAPGILIATWLTTRPSVAIVGAGVFIVFLMHIGFNSTYSANPVVFINDAIADLLAVLVSGVMYGLIDISSSQWSRNRIAAALRNLVVAACREPLALRRTRLETGARDLVQRAGSTQRIAAAEDRVVIDWLLSTLEIGHAVIALREQLQSIEHTPLAEPLRASLETIAELHSAPSRERRIAAITAIDTAMASLVTDAAHLGIQHSTRQQLLTMLHFLHSALLDEESVLASSEN
jgi:uncharacterized membrane protein YccC